jgi:hypothetical protein
MEAALVQMVFGWPFILLSLVASAIGITSNKAWPVLLGIILILPFCYYLNSTRMFTGVGLILPILHIGSAWAIKEESDLWAWLLLVPTTFISMWLFVISIIT